MDKIRKLISGLRTYDEACEPEDGWYIAYDDLQKSADTMEAMLKVVEAAEIFSDDMSCTDTECKHKVCVLNKALANLKGEGE